MNFSISLMVSHKFGLWLHPRVGSLSLSLYTFPFGIGSALSVSARRFCLCLLGLSPNSERYFLKGISPSVPYNFKVIVFTVSVINFFSFSFFKLNCQRTYTKLLNLLIPNVSFISRCRISFQSLRLPSSLWQFLP